MIIIKFLSAVVIFSFCMFLIGLAGLIVFKPRRAEIFLSSYASSARAHYTEQLARMLVGIAFVVLAPSMWYSDLLTLFGWILIVTTAGLLLVPWKWHHRFGEWAIPLTLRYMPIYSLGAFVLGILILYCFSRILLT